MAPLQKRALFQLLASAVLLGTVGLVLMLLNHGADFSLFFIVIAVGVVCEWLPRYLTRPKPGQPFVMDERDRIILSNVPKYQRFGIILAVFIWFAIFMSRTDIHGRATVTSSSLLLLVGSVIVADGVFGIVGTLIEYWRMR